MFYFTILAIFLSFFEFLFIRTDIHKGMYYLVRNLVNLKMNVITIETVKNYGNIISYEINYKMSSPVSLLASCVPTLQTNRRLIHLQGSILKIHAYSRSRSTGPELIMTKSTYE